MESKKEEEDKNKKNRIKLNEWNSKQQSNFNKPNNDTTLWRKNKQKIQSKLWNWIPKERRVKQQQKTVEPIINTIQSVCSLLSMFCKKQKCCWICCYFRLIFSLVPQCSTVFDDWSIHCSAFNCFWILNFILILTNFTHSFFIAMKLLFVFTFYIFSPTNVRRSMLDRVTAKLSSLDLTSKRRHTPKNTQLIWRNFNREKQNANKHFVKCENIMKWNIIGPTLLALFENNCIFNII